MSSEQLKQSKLYSEQVFIGEWIVYDIGQTTCNQLWLGGIINKPLNTTGISNKKPDALILDKNKNIIVFVESKDDGKLDSEIKIKKAIEQEVDVAKELGAKIYIIRDSNKNIWFNPSTGNEILNEDGTPFRAILEPKKEESERIIKMALKAIYSGKDRILKEVYLDPSDLAKRIWQKLYNIKKTSPSNALYTFVELFMFKYLSDIGILKGENSFNGLLKKYEDEGATNKNVLTHYLGREGQSGKDGVGIREEMKKLFPRSSIDGTTIINGTIFHEEIKNDSKIFKDILFEFKEYEKINGKFINISKDFKSMLFETFLKADTQTKLDGQYFTPLKIVEEMVRMVDIKEGMSICDPACGVGKFLLEAVNKDNNIEKFYKYNNGKIESKVHLRGYDVYSNDDEDRTIILAKANGLIYYSKLLTVNNSETFTKEFAEKILNDTFILKKNAVGTLEEIEYNTYDLILANPPYIVNGSKDFKALLSPDFEWGGLGKESSFIEWIVKSLKSDGVANIVVPDGILFNNANTLIREKIIEMCDILSIISLPNGSFFNTPKKTYIITLKKKVKNYKGQYEKQTKKVFTYICKSIGETLDTYRNDTVDDNDLRQAVNKYLIYNTNSDEALKYIQEDKQLKLISIDYFIENASKSWAIEKCWSEEEKISIGLKNKVEKVTVNEFQELLLESKEKITQNIDGIQTLIETETETDISKFKEKTLEELFNFYGGYSFKKSDFVNKKDGTTKVIRIQDISSKSKPKEVRVSNDLEIPNIDKIKIKEDDYLLSLSGTLCFTKYKGEEGLLNQRIMKLELQDKWKNSIKEDYLLKLVEELLNSVGKGANNNVSIKDVRSFKVRLPIKEDGTFDMEKQEEIAKKYEVVEGIKRQLIEQIEYLKELNIDVL